MYGRHVIVYTVAHCPWNEERRGHLVSLQRSLAGHKILVTEDAAPPDNKGCWGTQRRAILAGCTEARRTDATHVMDLCDDMVAGRNTHTSLERIAVARPDAVIGCFTMKKPESMRAAFDRGAPFFASTAICGGTVLMPVAWAERMVAWFDANLPHTFAPNGDDERIVYYAKHIEKTQTLLSAPSLFQHLAPEQSLVGFPNKTRTAKWFIGNANVPDGWWESDTVIRESPTNRDARIASEMERLGHP